MSAIRDEIRWEGSNEDIVWKSPIQDFSTGSSVIVHESQCAVFYLNGKVSQEIEAGIHVLETCKLPITQTFINKITKSDINFSAELYFINKIEMANLKWGVGDISYSEAGYVFPIGARGVYNIKIDNPRKIIEKINGMQIALTKEDIEERFRILIGNTINTVLINSLYSKKISIVYAVKYREELARDIMPQIEKVLLEYGFLLTQFVIEKIYVNEDNVNYKKLLSLLETEGSQERILKMKIQKEKTEAELAAYTREVQGYTYHDERKYDILEVAASNENSGGMASNFMQLGAGIGLAGSVSGLMSDMDKKNEMSQKSDLSKEDEDKSNPRHDMEE